LNVKQGDIIKLNLDPTSGHEQAGYRPVIVVSNKTYKRTSNMTLICPITHTNRNNPVHVELYGTKTTGYVLTDHIRSVDLQSRPFNFVENINNDNLLWEICDIAQGGIDVEI
jgi:mRNA interferase MazF